MLQSKDTTNISEINGFFTSSEKVCQTVLWIVRSLNLYSKQLRPSDSDLSIHSSCNILTLLLLFPLFQFSNVRAYGQNFLSKLFKGGKDVFYRFNNDEMINWRALHYQVTSQLIGIATATEEPIGYKCLIADDTDLPKTGWSIELIGRIWSHVTNSNKLGFKGLFLGYHDGKSFFGIDFSLHGERGKNEKKSYGLTPKQLKGRYSKKRSVYAAGSIRKAEYFVRLFLDCLPADMRKGFNGLGGLATDKPGHNLLSGDIFIFVNRARTMIKILVWDQTGFAIWHKLPEQGTFEIPLIEESQNSVEISRQN